MISSLETDRFRITVGAALNHLIRVNANAASLLPRAAGRGFGRLFLRRLRHLETCLQRTLDARTRQERVRALDFCVQKIDETKELITMAAIREKSLGHFARYIRPLLNTIRAMLTASLRLVNHSATADKRGGYRAPDARAIESLVEEAFRA